VRAPESSLSLLSETASQTVAAEDGRNSDVQGPELGGERKLAVELTPRHVTTDDTGAWRRRNRLRVNFV